MAFSISSTMIYILSIAIFTTLASADNQMLPGEMLNHGESLHEGRYTFMMQEDCNLVLYNLNKLVWESRTKNEGSRCYVTLETNGNLVIYDINRNNHLIWSSNTDGENGDYALILQNDGSVLIYSKPIFVIPTKRIGFADVILTLKHNRKVISVNP